jgi:hypothetical protein
MLALALWLAARYLRAKPAAQHPPEDAAHRADALLGIDPGARP